MFKENVQLAPLTSLHIGGTARYFCEVKNAEELQKALVFAKEKNIPVFVIGGGSNILVSDEGFPGLVIKIAIKGRELLGKDIDEIRLRVGAGEVLDEIVDWTVQNKWWGMENLSFVPGLVGALVIQNVNAYGAKAEYVVESVEVFDRNDLAVKHLNNAECKFRYRTSIFNHEEKNRYVVLSVILKLFTSGEPNISYIDVRKYFAKRGVMYPSIAQMREAIIGIRKRKGQDLQEYWSAGSFFSNLMLTEGEFAELQKRVRDFSGDALADELVEIKNRFTQSGELDPEGGLGKIKIPAGFLLDRVLDLKGKKSVGDAKISHVQALNIINAGNATARDVLALYSEVCALAKEKLGVTLVNEPEFVGFE